MKRSADRQLGHTRQVETCRGALRRGLPVSMLEAVRC